MKTNLVVYLCLAVAAGIMLSTSSGYAATRYVDGSVASSGAGTSWATAKKTVQEAVTAAAEYDQIWVKAGTYPLATTIALNKSVFLFGGFAGSETALSQRNLKANVTILDGQNARQCISITSDNVTVDGFSITRGYATGATMATNASGIYINTYSSGNGGGVYVTMTNCKLYSNTNVSAIYMYVFSGTISNCIFYSNTTVTGGAGIFVENSQAVIVNCTVAYNSSSSGSGGGIYVLNSNGSPGTKIINTILWYNQAGGVASNLARQSSSTLVVWYSNIQGGWTGGTGIQNTAPGFVSVGTSNYHLAPGAATYIDRGTNAATNVYGMSVFPATDFEGDARIVGTNADIGADEYFVATAPTVTTTAVTGITTSTAAGGGNVTADGGSSVTARGVCWGTAANPTTAGSHTSDGTGTGSFSSTISGLGPATSYHVRAYATNSAGTAYGGDVAFSTTAPLSVMLQGNGTGTVQITPPGTVCSSGTCSETYPAGTPVTLTYTTAANTLFDGWSGDCTNSSGNCNVVMDSIKVILAAFSIDADYAVWIEPGTLYYATIGNAYHNAASGSSIKACRLDFTEDLVFNQGKTVSLRGGYVSDYSKVDGLTGIVGTITLTNGSVVAENIVIK